MRFNQKKNEREGVRRRKAPHISQSDRGASVWRKQVVVVAGFEPATAGVKVLCLTAWRYHNMKRVKGIEPSSPAWKAGIRAIIRHAQIEPFLHSLAGQSGILTTLESWGVSCYWTLSTTSSKRLLPIRETLNSQ